MGEFWHSQKGRNAVRIRRWGKIILIISMPTVATAGSITGSKHDLSSLDERAGVGAMVGVVFDDFQQACVYCHITHNSGTKVEGRTTSVPPKWNRFAPASTYTPYQSPTLDMKAGQPSGVSIACLSCHDGSLAVDRVIKPPKHVARKAPLHMRMGRGGGTDECSVCHRGGAKKIEGIHDIAIKVIGSELRDDHPISISYPTGREDREFHAMPTDGVFGNGLKLFNGRVECATCHDVHDPDNVPFLRTSKHDSSICLTCHMK